jgi:hypothetical protein
MRSDIDTYADISNLPITDLCGILNIVSINLISNIHSLTMLVASSALDSLNYNSLQQAQSTHAKPG